MRDALARFDEILRRELEFEAVLEEAGALALEVGDRPAALRLSKSLAALNPWSSTTHERLAQLHALDRDDPGAAREAGETLRLNPFLPLPRTIRIRSALGRNDLAGARRDLDALIGVNPASRQLLEGWFDRQKRAAVQRR